MPAGPIGTAWAAGSWPDTTWEAGSWADLGSIVIPAILEDITTLWCATYQPALHAARPGDDTTRISQSLQANALGYDGENDLNTALAKYIEATY